MTQIKQDETVYRLDNLTCGSCAAKFEKNVKSLPNVQDCKVNFGASKMTVYGKTTISELEEAGAFDQIKVRTDQQWVAETKKVPFWRNRENLQLLFSLVLLLLGALSSSTFGEKEVLTILLYIGSIVIGGWKLFLSGLKNLARLQFDMKVLMTIAILGAAAIGEWSEGATVVILFAISESLERYSMERARKSIRSLMEIAPKQATIRRNGKEITLSVDEIQVGDLMLVKPGQKIPMDGIISLGSSYVNQAPITGESIPVSKDIGDDVFAGTINQEGYLEIQVTKRVKDTTLSKIVHLVEEAQAERAPAQAFVDRFARYYTPAIMLLALLIAVLPPLFVGGWSEWIYRALALLVVGCPCALVISTPVAIVTAIGNAARHGVLIKGGIHLETAGSIDTIAFDKTGTLTKGTPTVTHFEMLSEAETKETLLDIAYALEKNSQHPIAAAISRYAQEHGGKVKKQVVAFTSVTGKGVEGRVGETLYRLGKPSYIAESLTNALPNPVQQAVEHQQAKGQTVMLLTADLKVLALFAVQDEIRSNSADVIDQLHRVGIRQTVMLTGDNQATAQVIGKQLGISQIQAELLPEDKLARIQVLRNQGAKVAMVGDGINDAPALATANLGIAMGGAGTDTALETADIALMGDDLQKIPFTIRLSRKALRVIKQNISFAFGLKLLALLLIIPGYLTLWMAVFADLGGTLLVTANALRLLKVREK
ncbi:Cd2+/Zn2+-exporting ATPase [Thermoactinomyces sp. DSM 45891]|uniref:heavy metal translocating P-type ATPase n=1 Tax=Thermoactinomyces sp. DSM 45891 TaxID=1761907 RepID=UPI000914028F|nr:heavy metal translocating P-type ATPase [Thermoactinomyces sp. DSM 45891]SFX51088.1 Cd2+/Zn2+-exporting ATPase [Thermoactinomyces sp. DSM 45891]